MRLVAGDGRNENETVVVIHVNDKNDLPPAFNHPLYEATLEEESQGPFPINLLQVNFLFASRLSQSSNHEPLVPIENRSDGTVSVFQGLPSLLINQLVGRNFLSANVEFLLCSPGNIIRVTFLFAIQRVRNTFKSAFSLISHHSTNRTDFQQKLAAIFLGVRFLGWNPFHFSGANDVEILNFGWGIVKSTQLCERGVCS